MAVKIVRQVKNVALLGVPTSAASLAAGHERGPAALRSAGLAERLTAAGFAVTDYGDSTTRGFEPDDEHPRTRGVARVLAMIEEFRPKMEVAVKSGALPIVLGGDNSVVLSSIAGMRRYYRNVSLIYLDRDAGLNIPNSTPSGCVDGMVISHVIGRGAPEMVRFWREPPLVREPDVALFGVERLDQPEQEYLTRSPLRRYMADDISRAGAAAVAEIALDRVHGRSNEFLLHIDLDVIASEDFAATNLSSSGGLSLNEVRQALAFWARQPMLAAIEISCYNPSLDADGAAAKKIIALLVEILAPRLESAEGAGAAEAPARKEAPSAEDGDSSQDFAVSASGSDTVVADSPAVSSVEPSSDPEPHAG